jgi:hypothetical protein
MAFMVIAQVLVIMHHQSTASNDFLAARHTFQGGGASHAEYDHMPCEEPTAADGSEQGRFSKNAQTFYRSLEPAPLK